MMDNTTINDNLGVLKPFYAIFEAKISESSLKWVAYIFVLDGQEGNLKWTSIKETKNTLFLVGARRWLHLASQRIYTLENVTNMNFHLAMVVAYALSGIYINIGI